MSNFYFNTVRILKFNPVNCISYKGNFFNCTIENTDMVYNLSKIVRNLNLNNVTFIHLELDVNKLIQDLYFYNFYATLPILLWS